MGVADTVAVLLVLILLVGSITAWVRCFRTHFPGLTIGWHDRRAVPWGPIELLIVFLLFVASVILPTPQKNSSHVLSPTTVTDEAESSATSHGARPYSTSTRAMDNAASSTWDECGVDGRAWRRPIIVSMVARIGWLVLVLMGLRVWCGARSADFGLTTRHVFADVKLGFTVFLLAAPALYGLQYVLTQFWPKEHPLIELLRNSSDRVLWLVVGISVVVVAPVVEEFFFRAVLQGWLERVCGIGGAGFAQRGGEASSVGKLRVGRALLPPLLSATVFAAMHAEHGPAWIPLFFFGCLLGFLYLRTHRLTASITLHFALNFYSFLLLILSTRHAK